MIPNIPKISVLVICYKQEDVIRRAMDSLIRQKDYIYEICINDDKSPDGTWDILLEYQHQYPDLVKPVRNDPNLFIFANIEASWKRPTGDLIYQLSGDDECPDGYFKKVVEFVQEKGIDYKNEAVCIYGDYKMVNGNGSSIIYKNELVNDKNALKLALRKLLSNRSSVYSRRVIDRFEPVSQGRSYIVETAQECQLQIFTDKNFYIPVVGNIYYAEIGVSVKMCEDEKRERRLNIANFTESFLASKGIKVSNREQHYNFFIDYQREGKLIKAIYHYLLSIDLTLGVAGLQFDRILFVLKRRLHNKIQV